MYVNVVRTFLVYTFIPLFRLYLRLVQVNVRHVFWGRGVSKWGTGRHWASTFVAFLESFCACGCGCLHCVVEALVFALYDESTYQVRKGDTVPFVCIHAVVTLILTSHAMHYTSRSLAGWSNACPFSLRVAHSCDDWWVGSSFYVALVLLAQKMENKIMEAYNVLLGIRHLGEFKRSPSNVSASTLRSIGTTRNFLLHSSFTPRFDILAHSCLFPLNAPSLRSKCGRFFLFVICPFSPFPPLFLTPGRLR